MNPSGASGAITAIHDAVTLANWFSTLRYAREKDIGQVFKEYRTERYPVAKAAFANSQMFTRNLGKVKSKVMFENEGGIRILTTNILLISQLTRAYFRSWFED